VRHLAPGGSMTGTEAIKDTVQAFYESYTRGTWTSASTPACPLAWSTA
jgi:hypothetical protein